MTGVDLSSQHPEGEERDNKPAHYDYQLRRLECWFGSCRLFVRLMAYVTCAVVVINLHSSQREILWVGEQKTIFINSMRYCLFISKAPLDWSDGNVDALEGSVSVFETDGAVDLGTITTMQNYCGFSLDEVVEASFMMHTIKGLEEEGNSGEGDPCLTPLYCRLYSMPKPYEGPVYPYGGNVDALVQCDQYLENHTSPRSSTTPMIPWCYEACDADAYQRSLLLTLVNESKSQVSLDQLSGCEEREKFLSEIFSDVPEDRFKVAAFIHLFRSASMEEAMGSDALGFSLIAAVALAGVLWTVQLANFLYLQFRGEDEDNGVGWGEWLSRKILTSTLILVTWLYPLAILRPFSGAQTMPEPLADTILMFTPSGYPVVLVCILLALLLGVPLMVFGGYWVSKGYSCSAGCTWLLALVVCLSATVMIFLASLSQGVFFYVDLSMVFSLNFTWNISATVDLVQLLFFLSLLLEVASLIIFISGHRKEWLGLCGERWRKTRRQAEEHEGMEKSEA